jgi:hypothetical protein
MDTTKIALFRGKEVRSIVFQNEWWFSIIDVIRVLTDSDRPSAYWTAMKVRVKTEDGFQLSTICRQLKLVSSDGKKYDTDCSNIEGIFRIIQSIPSPKAEPFKRWLAKVGYERVQEIEDPELGSKRENLRDHMDDFELIFTMLGERSTTEIHKVEDSKGVIKLKDDANRGGRIAGNARKELETELKRSVVSKKNQLKIKG